MMAVDIGFSGGVLVASRQSRGRGCRCARKGGRRILANDYLRLGRLRARGEDGTLTKASASVRLGRGIVLVVALVALALLVPPQAAARERNEYAVTPLVSSNGVTGTVVDSNLVNAWGLAASATSPWWVADNGADLSTLYNAAGGKVPLEVTVQAAPTGVVFNGATGSFLVGTPGATSRFIFSTEGGTINGWAPGMASAAVAVDESEEGAVYKGLAIAATSSGPRLYATDFARGVVDVYDGTWADVDTEGGFMDAMMPAGYAPFGIQTIGSRIFVTFAKQGLECCDEQGGQGLGFVDTFDFDGNLLVRVAQHGQLNAPWGLAWAPPTFGRFSNDLLVGNFADGRINAYEELANGHFEFRGYFRMSDGQPVVIDGLWALEFGHGSANNGPTDTLFFTAGPNDETEGLFGSIQAA